MEFFFRPFPRLARDARASRRNTILRHSVHAEALEPRQLLAVVSGSLTADTVWTAAESPYEVVGNVVVEPNVTLTIEPGAEVRFRASTGLEVKGRLVAEGTPTDRIRFDRVPGGGKWSGLKFDRTQLDNRITYADMIGGDTQGGAIEVDHARLFLDQIVWSGTSTTILELSHPSLIVRNSQFPTSSGGEIIHGTQLSGDEYLVIEGNVFANSNNEGDVIDFLGADRPGPVLQVLNNVFLGGGDDGLDLDGTDAHIEGNVFMNFHKNTSRNTTSNAIATGLPQTGAPNRTEITVVRNLFVNNDHALLLKEDAFATLEHNVFIDSRIAAIQFNEVGGTAVLGAGKGAALLGNIFSGNNQLFKNLIDTPAFRTLLNVDYNLIPNEIVDFGGAPVNAHDLGIGNLDGDPMFVDPAAGDYALQDTSPARGQAPDGLDLGAYVPAGATVTARGAATPDGSVTLDVGGPGVTEYRYRVPGGELSELRPVSEPIVLSGLAAGQHSVEVVAQNSAGEWYTGTGASWKQTSIRLITPLATRPNEILPIVASGVNWQGQIDTAYTDQLSLDNTAELSETGLIFKKGVATLAPTVQANADFQVSTGDDARQIRVLGADFPTQSVAGALAGDVVWTADTEYHVTGDLTIPAGSSLTIEAGTRVLLGDRTNLLVAGRLQSLGTMEAPVLFNSLDPSQPWGGLEFTGSLESRLQHTFLTNGGADTTRTFGHSNSQPVIKAVRATVTCDGCYVIADVGKGFAASSGYVNISNSVISRVDTGGEFSSSVARIDHTWLINIPDDQQTFVDDDNDGFYFSGAHASGEVSRFEDSFVINTKDDGLDHNGARLEVVRAWIEGAFHEGIASSNTNWVTISDSVFMHNNQGVEAGYGGPDVTLSQSVLVANRNQVDPGSPITAGLRFGDGYDGSNGAYTGHITATYAVLYDNGDNVRNYDGTIPGPQPGAIDITMSLANDNDAVDPSNLNGVPVFSPTMHLLRGSAGFSAGPDGMPVGRIIPAVVSMFIVPVSGDFNADGVIDAIDIDLLCDALQAELPPPEYDLNGDGVVNDADRDELIQGRLQTTYGDANLDGVFDSADLVAVFVLGEYEDASSGNSGWAAGDWNCDGDFDSGDLVLAFQSGGYVAAAVDEAFRQFVGGDALTKIAAALASDKEKH